MYRYFIRYRDLTKMENADQLPKNLIDYIAFIEKEVELLWIML